MELLLTFFLHVSFLLIRFAFSIKLGFYCLAGWIFVIPSRTSSFSIGLYIDSSRKLKSIRKTRGAIENYITVSSDYETINIKGTSTPEEDAFSSLALCVTRCLLASDAKRDTGFDGASTGWTSWIEQQSEYVLRACLDRMCLTSSDGGDKVLAGQWSRWMKAVPAPLLIDLSTSFRNKISSFLPNSNDDDNNLQQEITTESASSKEAFLSRIACRIILLPSGCELQKPFQTPTGGIAYGKLLYGGVKRYRLIGSTSRVNGSKQQRCAGERTAIMKFPQDDENNPCWSQYGGPGRKYEAVDMGPAAFMEIILLPVGLRLPHMGYQSDKDEIDQNEQSIEDDMMTLTTTQLGLNPSALLTFTGNKNASNSTIAKDKSKSDIGVADNNDHPNASNPENGIIKVIGGLRNQIETITRRVLVSKEELQDLQHLGLTLRPRGLLLYGEPGTGKTILAKEIARHLNARSMKAVAAPELLDKWVGGSEKLVRELFKDAEEDINNGLDVSSSPSLHVIVIDEIDAVFRKRSISQDSGEITRNSLVNQLLSKIDGVRELPNVLVIGMTNRKELIDKALLRPGRLEVQLFIPLPDAEGRREILKIHFGALLKSGRLSKPLCLSINGESKSSSLGKRRYYQHLLLHNLKWFLLPSSSSSGRSAIIQDLAADHVTGGFSGADLAGLVRCAGSMALARSRRDGSGVDGVLITLPDVERALDEIKEQRKIIWR